MQNPFVYGEVVPSDAFADRDAELDRLVSDLTTGQKVFLISPRRYGKSSLVRQALTNLARRGALTVELTVSSYSSYVAFLEGYARALASVESRWERARTWLTEAISSTRPEIRYDPKERASVSSRCRSPPSTRRAISAGLPTRSSSSPAGLPNSGNAAS